MRPSQYSLYKHKVSKINALNSSHKSSFLNPLSVVYSLYQKKNLNKFFMSTIACRVKLRCFGPRSLNFVSSIFLFKQTTPLNNYNLLLWYNYLANTPSTLSLKYSNLLVKSFPGLLSRQELTSFYNLLLGASFTERSFRVLFSLPVNGQKSWSPIKTTSKYKNFILSSKYTYFSKILPKTTYAMFYSEYFNLMYQAFFGKIWRISKKNTRKGFFGKRFININNSFNLNGLNLPSLKKTSKSKNLGFKFGFTKKLKQHLL